VVDVGAVGVVALAHIPRSTSNVRRFMLLVLTAGALCVPQPAGAKMLPFYSVELPLEIGVGQRVPVTVQFFDDEQHTQLATGFRSPHLDGIVRLFPIDAAGAPIKSEQTPVTVRRIRPGVYRGWLTLPDARRWVVCGLQCDGPIRRGYPQPRTITPTQAVVAPGDGTASEWSVWTSTLVVAAAVAVLVSLAVTFRRRILPFLFR
jgi:hypothetical protein